MMDLFLVVNGLVHAFLAAATASTVVDAVQEGKNQQAAGGTLAGIIFSVLAATSFTLTLV